MGDGRLKSETIPRPFEPSCSLWSRGMMSEHDDWLRTPRGQGSSRPAARSALPAAVADRSYIYPVVISTALYLGLACLRVFD